MKALVTANVDKENRRRLKEDLGLEVDYQPIAERDERLSESELIEAIEDVDVLIVGFEGVSEKVLDAAEQLELIACPRGGPDANVDISAASERNIPVLYAPGRNAVSVADFTIGLMIDVARHISHGHHLLHTGTYTGEPVTDSASGGEREDVTWGVAKGSPYAELKGPELEGKTVGIVGFGDIGREVGKRVRGFGVDILAMDPFIPQEEMPDDVTKVDLDELCEQSDFVTVHVPVTDATRGLIGSDEFALMKETAFFINTARGAIIDQDALIQQLKSDNLRGAALDVYDEEPLPEDHVLLELENVVTTPHLAGAAEEVINRHSTMIVDDIEAIFEGEEPKHIADDSVLQLPELRGDD
ncbi:2-hydroxyacid dehydrogenase [Natronococcus occultus]|uniref:Phosphoglycerate dehydrogenase-like oxidoreductase n=1 Tax=Natronococcus occultus SP4 TaxID=694430 RepID=L0JYZ4_9EURY|nr:2-hydroxyacid dehydrogenase [Natronococcus occultus]AGB37093.1 phosphoglycerate dehydrogenase-like oxidoreductase [Natronococcus occultus SP4]